MLIFNKIIAFMRSKSPLFWIVTAAAFGIIILAINLITTYTLVSVVVTYNDAISEKATLYSMTRGQGDKQASPLMDNLYLLRRDTVALRASTDNYSTIKELTHLSPQETITINLYKDKNADKYSGNNPGCITYDNASNRLLSYSCTQPRELLQYDQSNENSAPQNSSVATIAASDSLAYSVKPYQGGVLGIRMPRFLANVPTNKFLFSIDSNGKITEASTPDSLGQEQLSATNVITDTTSVAGSEFLLVNKQTSSLSFARQINGGAMDYKSYSLPEDFSPTLDTLLCSLLGSTAYCFYGYSSGPPDSEEETKHHESKKPATFLVIDFSGETPAVERYTTKQPTPVDNLFVTKSEKLYATSGDDLLSISLSDATAWSRVYATSVGSVAAGDGLYFVRDNSVYRLDDEKNESYLAFSSPKLRLSNIVSLNENVFVNAYIGGTTGQRVHTYRLNDEPNERPGFRLIDTLPLALNESDDISDMDLYKNNLHIRVKVPVSKTGRNAGADLTAFNAAKQRITNLLQEKSIDVSALRITYSY